MKPIKIQKFLNFLFYGLIHKNWFYIFISENNDAWPLFFICCIIIFFYILLSFNFILRKFFMGEYWHFFFFFFFRKFFITFANLFLKLFFGFLMTSRCYFLYIWKNIRDRFFINFENYDLYELHILWVI